MGLFDWAKNQFIEIIEWVDDSRNTLVYRFPVYRKEIKSGAQLTVREGQAAVVVNEGQIADVFGPGLHKLTTRNMPILSTLKGWKYGFESP
ncbi:MAG: SPFH domain-containing protein, partial [Planctomycetes bacterium]|nr:SPFH domain-containing protein [Planctomycetota bacterium]